MFLFYWPTFCQRSVGWKIHIVGILPNSFPGDSNEKRAQDQVDDCSWTRSDSQHNVLYNPRHNLFFQAYLWYYSRSLRQEWCRFGHNSTMKKTINKKRAPGVKTIFFFQYWVIRSPAICFLLATLDPFNLFHK